MHWMAADRLNNFACQLRELSDAQRQVKLLDLALRKLVAQSQMRQVMFGHHQAAAGFLIESMNDTRPKLAPDSAQI